MKKSNPALRDRARELRKHMTEPEKKLYYCGLVHLPVRVHRQHVIRRFIVDFYIVSAQLVIEVDGDSHYTEDGKAYDAERTIVLQGLGLTVVRFTNREAMENLEEVMTVIRKHVEL